jgi:hypothetical protein
MKMNWCMEVKPHAVWTSALDGYELMLVYFVSMNTYRVGCLVGFRVFLIMAVQYNVHLPDK